MANSASYPQRSASEARALHNSYSAGCTAEESAQATQPPLEPSPRYQVRVNARHWFDARGRVGHHAAKYPFITVVPLVRAILRSVRVVAVSDAPGAAMTAPSQEDGRPPLPLADLLPRARQAPHGV